MKDVTENSADDKAAAIRVQVRNQIRVVTAQKTNLPKMIENLQNVLAREDVKAAFGDGFKEVESAVADLAK